MGSFYRFITRWQNWLALILIGAFILISLTASWLEPQNNPDEPSPFYIYTPSDQKLGSRIPIPPNQEVPLGTMPGGYDVLYSLVWGAYPALRFGLLTALSTATIGVLLGALSAYVGGWTNGIVMRLTDAFLAFPAIAGVFFFQQLMTPLDPNAPPGWFHNLIQRLDLHPVMLALILFSWMPYARIINAGVNLLKSEEYILSAHTLGASHARILIRHLLPNGISPVIVMFARDVGAMVILEASFTFIGISGYLPWGVLLVSGRNWIIGPGGNPLAYWWVFLPVTLALVLFGLGWNLLGDGLNDALNPKTVNR